MRLRDMRERRALKYLMSRRCASAGDLGAAAIAGEVHRRSPVATSDLGVKIGLHFVKRGIARVNKYNRFEWVPK